MKIIPVLTEKSMSQAKEGFYTFFVGAGLTKNQIREAIERAFDVHVTSVHTMNFKKGLKKNSKGETVTLKARKKTIVTLAKDEKIDLFEEKKGK